jgi:transcriptional regulator with XRE-family HTH domain
VEEAAMREIRKLRKEAGVTQRALAEAAGTSQPTIAAYEGGRKSPTLETVRRLANAVGLEMTVEYHPPLTREERRSLALHEAIAERVHKDPEPVLRRARKSLARMKEANPGAAPLLREWEILLDRPLQDLLPVLTDQSPRGRELRQVTPFAGVLSAADRAAVYRAFREAEGRAS